MVSENIIYCFVSYRKTVLLRKGCQNKLFQRKEKNHQRISKDSETQKKTKFKMMIETTYIYEIKFKPDMRIPTLSRENIRNTMKVEDEENNIYL